MKINPIRNDEQLAAANSRLDEVFMAEDGTPEGDERDVLWAMIESYERIHIPMGDEISADSFGEYIKRWGVTQASLAETLGSRSVASQLVSGQRRLSIAVMQKLHYRYHMSYERLMPFALRSQVQRVS